MLSSNLISSSDADSDIVGVFAGVFGGVFGSSRSTSTQWHSLTRVQRLIRIPAIMPTIDAETEPISSVMSVAENGTTELIADGGTDILL